MPPKLKYTKADIIRVSREVVEEHGLSDLTARLIASKLGSSTSPVYRHFLTMDELALAVIRETQTTLLEYISRYYTDKIFLNMGTGVVMFACEHPRLYKALMLEGDKYYDVVQEILDTSEKEMANDPRLSSLSTTERRELLDKMWLFTHGLASLVCVGLIKECNQEFITKTLEGVGADVIGAVFARHDNRNKANKKQGKDQ